MNGEDIVMRARKEKGDFGLKCRKFVGAVAAEILKDALANEDIPTSPRDVFVQGVPIEIDILVPRKGAKPSLGLLYTQAQVAAALEVKNSGSYGKNALEKMKENFKQMQKAGIPCAYVSFEERKSYKWRATPDRIGAPCFTLAWHKDTNGDLEPTEDWQHLLKFLHECLNGKNSERQG